MYYTSTHIFWLSFLWTQSKLGLISSLYKSHNHLQFLQSFFIVCIMWKWKAHCKATLICFRIGFVKSFFRADCRLMGTSPKRMCLHRLMVPWPSFWSARQRPNQHPWLPVVSIKINLPWAKSILFGPFSRVSSVCTFQWEFILGMHFSHLTWKRVGFFSLLLII